MSLILSASAESLGISGITLSHQRLLRETESRPVTSIVCQCQLQLHGHVACYPEADDPCCLWRPKRRPQDSWLGHVDASCRDLFGMGKEPAWRHEKGDRQGWCQRVGEVISPWVYDPND